MNKKIKLTVLSGLLIASLALTYALDAHFSNIGVMVVGDFTITVSNAAPEKYSNVTFSGHAKPDTPVTLYLSPDNSTWTPYETVMSDGTGTYAIMHNMTSSGTIYYKAGEP